VIRHQAPLWIGASSSITVDRARADAASRQSQLAARADHIRQLGITGNEALTIMTAALPSNH